MVLLTLKEQSLHSCVFLKNEAILEIFHYCRQHKPIDSLTDRCVTRQSALQWIRPLHLWPFVEKNDGPVPFHQGISQT